MRKDLTRAGTVLIILLFLVFVVSWSVQAQEKIPPDVSGALKKVDVKEETPVEGNSNDPVYLSWLGSSLAVTGEYERAKKVLDRSIALSPDYAPAHHNLSYVLSKLGRQDDALAAAKTAVRLNKSTILFTRQLCVLLFLSGKQLESVSCYESMIGTTEFNPEMMSYYSHGLVHTGQALKAQTVLDDALTRFPTSEMLWNAKGLLLFKSKKYEEAKVVFNHALVLNDKFNVARYNIAICELLNKNRSAAIQQYGIIKFTSPELGTELFKLIFHDKIRNVN